MLVFYAFYVLPFGVINDDDDKREFSSQNNTLGHKSVKFIFSDLVTVRGITHAIWLVRCVHVGSNLWQLVGDSSEH